MERFAVYAAEQKYGGLHGMCTYEVIEAKNKKEAEEYAYELSYDIMESYGNIMEEIEEEAKYYMSMEDSEEDSADYNDIFWSYVSEIRDENVEYVVRKIDEEIAKGYSTAMLDNLYNKSPDNFEIEFCLED